MSGSGQPRSRPLRVLLASELGGGLGHVAMAAALARALAAAGCDPVIACPDPARARQLPAAKGCNVVQGLQSQPDPRFGGRDYLARSFADVLAWWGFGDVGLLSARIRAWQHILAEQQPQVVVAEYAPALCLALHGDPRLLAIGNGFCLPPCAGAAFPVLVPGVAPLLESRLLVECIGQAMQQCGLTPLPLLPHLHGPRVLVTALPQIDPYLDLRAEPPIGPLDLQMVAHPPPPVPRWFAYLSGEHACTEPLLRILAACGIEGSAYVRDLDPVVRAALVSAGVRLHDTAPDLGAVLPGASFVVHHASAGLAQAALAAGRPQLLAPTDLEKRLYARMLQQTGTGIVLDGRYTGRDVRHALAAVASPALQARATESSSAIQRSGPWSAMDKVLHACVAPQ